MYQNVIHCGPWGHKHGSTSLELWSRERKKMQLYNVITANVGNQQQCLEMEAIII